MAHTHGSSSPLHRFRHSSIALACAGLCGAVAAQTAPSTAPGSAAGQTTQLPPVTVSAHIALPLADVAGFGDTPIERLPLQAVSVGEAQLKDSGSQGLRELARQDASVSDAYNAVGYWDSLTVRGFVIDQRYNYRRDGLPITGETAIGLDNKSRLELLKGTSGIQAGTSAPGGLVNLVVKRPDVDLRSVTVELRGAQTALAAVDLSTRFGEQRVFGLRVNAAIEHLDPELRSADGHRHLLAVAGDWRLTPDTLIEAEIESSRRSQASQPGFSLLGDRVPSAHDTDPRINLNNQPWSQPVVFQGHTASLRLTQKLNADWRAVLHLGRQQLKTDDRTAFPFGCYDAGSGDYYPDRYCPNGSFDLYDYRSETERRRMDAADLSLQGRLQTGPVSHTLTAGVLRSRFESRLQGQAYNQSLVGGDPYGQGSVEGNVFTDPNPTLTYDNTNRDERSTELYMRDALQLGPDLGLWLGLRHTRLERSSITTSGTEATQYSQSFTTPWLGGSWSVAPGHTLYASWGRGVESAVVPGRPEYADAGQAQPARKSRQTEVGYKLTGDGFSAGLAVFEIRQPATTEVSVQVGADSLTRIVADGLQVHRGLELNAQSRLGAWTLGGSAQWLRAEREGSADVTLGGTRPANVPERSLRLQASHEFAMLPALKAFAALIAESDRTVMPGSAAPSVPGWARIDVGASYEQRIAAGQRLLWRAGIDNLADRRAWKEAPYQFGHVYLYPMAPRTWRVSLQADL